MKTGTAINDNILVINDDDVPPTTTFTLMKWAKPHPESDPDSNEKPITAAMMDTPTKPPARDLFRHFAHHHTQHKTDTAQCAAQSKADTVTLICSWSICLIMTSLIRAKSWLISQTSLLTRENSMCSMKTCALKTLSGANAANS